jgi:hypothetical protein
VDADRGRLRPSRADRAAGTCRLYELFGAAWNDGDPRAGSGAIFDLDTNRLRPETWTSADAVGLPILAGLVRWDEVKAGSIRMRSVHRVLHDGRVRLARAPRGRRG